MALTKDRNLRTKANITRKNQGDVAANAVIFLGALLAANAAGYVVPASDAAAVKVLGFAEEAVNNTGGANGAKKVMYMTGVVAEMDNAAGAIVQANKHGAAYAAGDDSVTTAAAAANDLFVGIVTEFSTTKVWVFVDEANTDPAFDGAQVDTVANLAVSPALGIGGITVLIPIDIPDAATATYSYITREKIEIVDVWNIKDGAGAANTILVTTGADVAITNAMAAAVDKTLTRAGTIDKATRVLAAGATFKVVATRAAGSMAAQLFILAIKRA